MPGSGVILREIHRLRRHAKDLTGQIEQGPRQVKAQKASIVRQEEALKKAQDELKQLKIKTHDKEVSLQATEDQIRKYEKQLNDIISKKEYDAIKHELATCRAGQAKLEDEVLQGMMDSEELQAKIREMEKALAQARVQAAQLEGALETRQADLGRQRDAVVRQLAEVEATLPVDNKPLYDRLIASQGEDAMSGVANRVCLACYTEITAQNFNDLSAGKFLLCKSCGRILYLPD